ncbi:MAG: BON domain-containing protein [Alphaproteobacteria bacterium]|nr:BON domain-containing protein [Alphaproteobacteria bacterium]
MKNIITAAVAVIAFVGLSGCTPVTAAAGIGAGIGIAAAQEGGLKTAVTDKAIHLKVSDLWLSHSGEMYRKLNLTVKEGRVLVAGSVPTADMRVEAVRLAWQAEGVRQVINEIAVDEGGGVTGYVGDAWISSNLKTQFVFDKKVQSINYNIETVNGTVYLMGIAQDNAELTHVLGLARNTRSVKNVVSYVRLRGETPPGVLEPTTPSAG